MAAEVPASWRRDGWEARWRIGVLTPYADVGPESELQAMAPPEVAVHATRVPFGGMASRAGADQATRLAAAKAFAEPPFIDDGAELLAAAPLNAIAYGFTSSGYVIGAQGEASMVTRLEGRTRGIPVVAACTAMVAGLRCMGASRLALVDPPWFDPELSQMGRRYYEAEGFDVLSSGPCDLPSDQAKITPDALHGWVVTNCPDAADAVVIGGNGFRAVGVIDALESKLDRLVLTANQALFWASLQAAGATASRVTGYGSLFRGPGA
jgi:maleate isomerase